MGDKIVVKTATLTLRATPPLIIVTTTHTLSLASSGPFATGEGNELMLESDLDASLLSYVSSYNNPPYVGGSLKYQSIQSVSGLSQLLKKSGDPVITMATKGTIMCSVLVPAPRPVPPPPPPPPTDPLTSYTLDFSISSAGQTVVISD